jgi:hypothetical protein
MPQTNVHRQYVKNSQEDLDWVAEQEPCVQQLWLDCVRVEKYGEHFNVVKSKLSRNSFTKAKNILEEQGLFEFEPIQKQSQAGRWQVLGWKVRNLHGSKNENYWKPQSVLAQQMGEDAQRLSEDAQQMGHVAQQMCKQNAVGFDTTGFDSSLLGSYKDSTINLLTSDQSSEQSRSGRSESAPLEATHSSLPDALNPDSGASLRNENPEQPETFCDSKDQDSNPSTNMIDHSGQRVPPRAATPTKSAAETHGKAGNDTITLNEIQEALGRFQPPLSCYVEQLALWLYKNKYRSEARQLMSTYEEVNSCDEVTLEFAIAHVKDSIATIDDFRVYFSDLLTPLPM